MTGLVVVSHSRALADAAVGLAAEMLHGSGVRIAVAAGLNATTFGTDATAVLEAIHEADDGQGVVILMDLGSAVLSAEVALDMLDPDVRERTVLSPAPLVEGLVVAAVAAAGGAGPVEVAREGSAALAAKQSHLPAPGLGEPAGRGSSGGLGPPAGPVSTAPPSTAVVKIANPHGLHARPAARLVQVAQSFDARVELRNLDSGAGPVPATSLSRVATLGALCGHRVELSAVGSQAREALDHLVALAERRFDEDEHPVAPVSAAAPPSDGTPMGASPGIAIGPAVTLRAADVTIPDETPGAAETEWRRVREAIAEVRREIQRIRAAAARHGGESEARIFDAHLLLIDDTELLDDVRARITAGRAATRAWADAIAAVEATFAGVADDYLRARAADVHAVGQQVALALTGEPVAQIEAEGVLIADDLTPAQVAGLDASRVSGLVLAAGSPTGHSVILARARGIPAVVAAGASVLDTIPGTTVALDGSTGRVVVDPDEATLTGFTAAARAARARAAQAQVRSASRALTGDGVEVFVGANVGSLDDARTAAANGADLAGLVRTEFLYLERLQPPTVEEQIDIYRSLAEAMGGRRLTLRTLDVGGDKPLGYAPQPPEANPFLGMRGIRFALAQRELLAQQLQAIVAVAHETPVSVMFPMVSTVAEVVEARGRLDEAIELDGRGRPPGFQVGMMAEVPAAALKATAFASYVDFMSIGTNDLTQYAMAAERGNAAVAALGDPLDPGVLRLVDAVCRAAEGRCEVAVCGELAADETAVPLLVALGVRELSVAPSSVALVKHSVRQLDSAVDVHLVGRCLTAASADEVRTILR